MIYFARVGEDGPIKIGFSDNVFARLSWLGSYFGERLRLLLVVPGDRHIERVMHERFAHLRLGSSRPRPKGRKPELFRAGDDLEHFIRDAIMREAKRLRGGDA